MGDRLAEAWPRKNARPASPGGRLAAVRLAQAACRAGVRSLPCPLLQQAAGPSPFASSFSCAAAAREACITVDSLAMFVDILVLVYVPVIIASLFWPDRARHSPRCRRRCRKRCSTWPALPSSSSATRSFGGAGHRQALHGLRVVQSKDGKTPLTYGQGVVRWLSQFIPFFNLVDAVGSVSRSACFVAIGDRWAGTRVIDTDEEARQGTGKDRAAT